MSEAKRKVFVAGATGAVGTLFVPKARAAGLEVVPHVRPATAPRHPLGSDPQAAIFPLEDATALEAALTGCSTVVCLVGTMRRRFDSGDTYESSDFRPVVDLVSAAKRLGERGPGHVVLLSSFGAREGAGYLGFKWRAEQAVRESGLRWTVLRPSMFDSRDTLAQPSDGRSRRPPPLVGGVLRALGKLPGLEGVSDDLRPIPLDVLATALVRVTVEGGPSGETLAGRHLWKLA